MAFPIQPLRLKICGQKTLADAEASMAAGADMIGVILFAGSKRFVPFAEATAWIRQVPPAVERVAVFVDPAIDEVRAALADDLFHTAQLHGNETPGFLAALNEAGFASRLIKALRVTDRASVEVVDSFPTRRFLLDGPHPGSGQTFDWSLAATAVERHPAASFLLAGGLTAETVGDALRVVRPHGVDVASGVEAAPGGKDPEKLRRFVQAARTARRIVESERES
ncbi:MAG: phosphoribosylanthranilate isomerase [Verrucomicrobiales bacterium]